MNTKRTTPPSPEALAEIFDAVVRAAVREDMLRIYGETPREERRAEPRKQTPIFSRRQAD